MRARPSLAIAGFELRRRWAAPSNRVLVGAFLALALGGRAVGGAEVGADLYGYGYLLVLLFGLSFGLADDRAMALDEFFAGNLVRPAAWIAGKVIATYAAFAAFGLLALPVAVVAVGGGPTRAAWPAVAFALVTWTAAPIVLVLEAATALRGAALVVAAALVVGVGATEALGGSPERVVALLGLDLKVGDYGSLAPLARRAVAVAPPLAGLGTALAIRKVTPRAFVGWGHRR